MSEENILYTLLSMGFEQEDCQKVLQNGVTDIQDAIQHLLLNNHGQNNSSKAELVDSSISTDSQTKDDEFIQRNMQLKATYNEQLRKRRLQERIEKDKILKDIQCDRMRQKDAKKLKDDATEHKDTATTLSSSSIPADQVKQTGRIQVRLPDGVNIQLSLMKDTTLQNVIGNVLESVEDKSLPYSLMQPFPRKEFKPSDMLLTLDELGLFPSARLVLFVQKPDEQIDINNEIIAALQEDISVEKGIAVDGDRPSCGGSRLLQGNMKNEINDDNDDIHGHHEMGKQKINAYGDSSTSDVNILIRKIDTLQTLSSHCVALYITLAEPKIINSMSVLSSKAASQIIDVLKSWKMLSPKLMSSFLPCKLKEINLDSYGLATNELLEKLRFHTSVAVLTLKSCALLNDQGLATCLKGLHHIKLLNLADCCRLTGNMLEYVADLTFLEVLILDKVKVTNGNLNKFLKTQQSLNLKKLSLDYCPISSDAFSHTKDCASLLSLSLNNTQVSTLAFLQTFPNLSKLNLQNTCITDEELTYVGKLNKLNTLKLRGTYISDTGLRHLHGLQLISFNTADRQTVTDETIAIINGFPLRNLDLSDHIYLTDACIPSIANIVSLTSLSLSNTKITDELLIVLSDLHNLETLDFSKTMVTNQVMLLLKRLHLLHTVNLAWTKIDDDVISDLNDCMHIFKLNLSHTNVTNNGIVKLQLNFLSILILDSTHVTWNGAETCASNCPNLTVLRNSAKKVLITHHR